MAFVALSSTDCDAGSPLTETLMQLIRTNFDDHESRIGSNEALAYEDILCNFEAAGVDAAVLDAPVSGAGTVGLTAGNGYVTLDSGAAAGGAALAAATAKMRVSLTKPHVITLKWRVKMTSAGVANFVMGLQDASLTSTIHSDVSDAILVTSDGAGAYNYYSAKASVSETSSTFGTSTNTTEIKMIINCVSAANITVDVYENNVLRYTATDESKMPTTTVLRPVIGVGNAGSQPIVRIDSFRAYWNAEPLSTL